MNKEGSLVKNIARVLSANFLVTIIGFAGSFIFPKILSFDDYALYHTFTLYVGYIGILHLGFPSGMVLKYAGTDYDNLDRAKYKAEVFILIAILTAFTLLFIGIAIFTQDRMVWYIAVAIIPIGITSSYKSLFQAWSQFKLFSKISSIIAIAVPAIALLFYVISGYLPGDVYIVIYLIVHWLIALWMLCRVITKTYKSSCGKILTKENWEMEKNGFSLVLGNYMSTLFVSADKQFIKVFYSNIEFAYYSFGMSMQNIMTVFIKSIAQPLFPAMAQGKFKDDEYNTIKTMLMVFGSFSGCAYFATAIIVNWFIPKYIDSLNVVGIYFVVFPAMAVVDCLYINLYKTKGLMATYIKTLALIFVTAIILNGCAVMFHKEYTGVAYATTITYYIWYILGFKQFKFLKFTLRDLIYLIVYMCGFFTITKNSSVFWGMILYFIFVIVLAMVFYQKDIKRYIKRTDK